VLKGLSFIIDRCGNPLKVPPNGFGLLNTPPLLDVLVDQDGVTKNFLPRFVHCLDPQQTLQESLL
jgi:hypothetical protein